MRAFVLSTVLAIVAPVALASSGFAAAPVFPTAKVRAAKAETVKPADVVPDGAQYRVRSGKGFRYVACNEARSFVLASGGSVRELHCLVFNKVKAEWGTGLKWYAEYNLFPMSGDISPAPEAVALR